MDKENKKHGSSKDSFQNGTTDFSNAGAQKIDKFDDMSKCLEENSSVRKKKISSSKKLDVFDGKYKGKKKKSYSVYEDADHASSRSVKHSSKNPQKHLVCETDLDYSEVLTKMHSSDNMRKAFKSNRRASVPNDPLELKNRTSTPLNYSSSYKGHAKSQKNDSKFRSKTPDSKRTSGNMPGRKSSSYKKSIRFEPYIPLFQVQQGLKRGEFIEGALRINPRNYEDAYVNSPDGKMDIYIGGMQNRNRALNGDIVVVQINPKQEWKVLCDAIKDYQEKCGKAFIETVCEPVLPSSPCKVHTPDPFIRPRPYSSHSWDGVQSARSPDTLEILGLDKLAKQFESISIKQKTHVKSKSKKKCGKQNKETGSQQSSTASYSQESSEDCLDKMSPSQYPDKDKEVVLKSDPHDESESYYKVNQDNSVTKENFSSISPENLSFQTYTPCDLQEIGEFHIETEINQVDNKWIDNENSVNLVISPEELLHIDGNSLLSNVSFNETDIFNDDNYSDIVGVVVAPGDLSGDEFTDSASIDSSYSEHMERVLEDSEFLACQQDAQNNNFELVSQSSEIVTLSNVDSLISVQAAKVSTQNSLDTQCKMQYNRSVQPIASSVHTNSEVVCSTVSDIFPEGQINAIDENVILQNLNIDFPLSHAVINDNQCSSKITVKKSRRKKRKKTSNTAKQNYVNDDNADKLEKLSDDICNLTVEQVMQHPEWYKFIQKTGKVVHILERKHSCMVAGHLKLFPDKNVKWALFSPNDSRVPRVMIPMSDCPQNFYYRSCDYTNVLFIAQVTEWNEYNNFAVGRLIKSLGNSGDIEVETEGILIENGVDTRDFEEKVLFCLPGNNWSVPADELSSRRDFRNQCVFTIDPSTARDMDDAVSCTVLDNGNYEVGVHIADVTYFVSEGTELDKIAKERSTSVYLVEKVIPMLPRRLCDDLCSLNPGKDRLTFSVVWEISSAGEIFNQWIGRSIINSCVKLSYEHAQDMIEYPTKTWSELEHPKIYGNFTVHDIIKRVNELHCLAVELRNKRFLDGALRLDQVKLQFTLDSETGLPSGFNIFVQKDSNKLIEEFMLLANMSVAAKIYETFPSLSLLRRHPPPQAKPMRDIVSMCESVGIVLDATTSGTLQNSIARYKGQDTLSNAMTLVLMNLCSKPMNSALYFCTGVLEDINLFHHYALNVPLYTHFTSPIRRYPDIIVHRLLGAALNYNLPPNMSAVRMEKCAVHCNDKKYNARRVSELSAELFLAAFIRNLGSVHARAMVIGVMDRSFDCLILDMGIIKRVYCDKLPLLKKEYKRSQGISYLNLTWEDESLKDGLKQTIIIFTLINVQLSVDCETLQIKAILCKPKN